MSGRGSGQTTKRSLPSWMSSRESNKSEESKGDGDSSKTKRSPHKKTREDTGFAGQTSEDLNAKNFSKLLEGVVFVLSGFVNPERGMLRSQALEMGAEFQQDWNSNCTLLVCAFPNTPKFRQVEAQCGTIVSKEWITECYTQKKLVEIDSYLMHAGKPWRKSNTSHVLGNAMTADDSTRPPRESQKTDKGLQQETSASKGESSISAQEELSPTKVKKWATDDLNKTMAWLECQDEKPEADQLKKVAAEGVLTCLQDAIDLLEQKQDLCQIREQWSFIPRVVEELIRSGRSEGTAVINQHHLHKRALSYKKMYEDEYRKMEGNSKMKGKGKSENTDERRQNNSRRNTSDGSKTEYDSDDTIEMTEEEINLAFRNISST